MIGVRRANSPNAPSTCSHAVWRSHRSATSAIGSKSPAFTSPALAITIAGAVGLFELALERREVEPADVVARETPDVSPDPSRASQPPGPRSDADSRSTGSPAGAQPPNALGSTSTPCCSPHQLRAAASATKLAIVAPVVSTPPNSAGSSNSWRSQSTATCSRPRRKRRRGPRDTRLVVRRREPVSAERRRAFRRPSRNERTAARSSASPPHARARPAPSARSSAPTPSSGIGHSTANRELRRPESARAHRRSARKIPLARRSGRELKRSVELVAFGKRIRHRRDPPRSSTGALC